MEPGNLADIAVQIMSGLATGAGTSVGIAAGEDVVRLVRDRLGGSEEGRAALARLGEEPQQLRTLLTDEIAGNAGFARQLEVAVLPTVKAGGDAHVNTLTVHDSKVSGTINIGPLTIHKTQGSYIVLAIAAVAVALLLVLGSIGTVNIINNFNDGSGGESKSVQDGSSAPEERWKFNKGMTPTVVDGVAYFDSMDKHLHAVDATTGKERWKFGTGGFSSVLFRYRRMGFTPDGRCRSGVLHQRGRQPVRGRCRERKAAVGVRRGRTSDAAADRG